MQQENIVLYWFRNDLDIAGNACLSSAINKSSALIPVFCFDKREVALADDPTGFQLDLTEEISTLRMKLQSYGTNLLVVYDNYERIIPSLARVLQVHTVITDADPAPGDPICYHRYIKTEEVKRLLNMHSILMERGEPGAHPGLPDIFPCFPEINPGIINIAEESLFRGRKQLLSASN